MKIACIIPARGGSKGIPKKNIMNFCGKPLIVWSIEQALACSMIKKVYVTSDSAEILGIATRAGAQPIRRPSILATDTATTEDGLMHALDHIEKSWPGDLDAVVFLQATSPLRLKGDIERAIRTFVKNNADSFFSSARLEDSCIWEHKNERWKSLTFDYKNRGRRQDRTPLFLENGSVYIFRPEVLRKYHNRLGGKIVTGQMFPWQSYEIDSPEDIEICEYFMKNKVMEIKKQH